MIKDFNNRDYLVLSPQNLNYEILFNDLNINKNIPKSIIGTVIRLLALKIHFNEIEKKETSDYKVSLCSNKLNDLYGNDYVKAIEPLISKFLFRYAYSENNCYKYALNDVTRKFKLEIHKLETKSVKGRGIVQRLRKSDINLAKEVRNKFKFMTKFFDNKKLEIDLNSVLKLIDSEYNSKHDYPKYMSQLQKVINIHNGAYTFSYKPETDGRFHTSFTTLNKKFRKHLTYQNKKLIEIDISNSIPTIFALLLTKSININLKEVLNTNIYSYLLMFNKTAESIDNKELQQFLNLSVKGKLYESLSNSFTRRKIDNLIDEYNGYYDGNDYVFREEIDIRKITKKNFLSMLFSNNDTYIDMELAFEDLFPTVFRFIESLKKSDNYKLLSHLLFQIESEIVLERIARPFNKLNNGRVPIFTIHDCICTVEGKEELLKIFMKEKFFELFGTNIGLKIKRV